MTRKLTAMRLKKEKDNRGKACFPPVVLLFFKAYGAAVHERRARSARSECAWQSNPTCAQRRAQSAQANAQTQNSHLSLRTARGTKCPKRMRMVIQPLLRTAQGTKCPSKCADAAQPPLTDHSAGHKAPQANAQTQNSHLRYAQPITSSYNCPP